MTSEENQKQLEERRRYEEEELRADPQYEEWSKSYDKETLKIREEQASE